jgi:hypothetical protein
MKSCQRKPAEDCLDLKGRKKYNFMLCKLQIGVVKILLFELLKYNTIKPVSLGSTTLVETESILFI